jgi:hypothetical protein
MESSQQEIYDLIQQAMEEVHGKIEEQAPGYLEQALHNKVSNPLYIYIYIHNINILSLQRLTASKQNPNTELIKSIKMVKQYNDHYFFLKGNLIFT